MPQLHLLTMDFVNVLRGLKKSRSEAKLGFGDRLSVGRKSSKGRSKACLAKAAPEFVGIPEDKPAPSLHSPIKAAPSLHSPPAPARDAQQTGDISLTNIRSSERSALARPEKTLSFIKHTTDTSASMASNQEVRFTLALC